jgi:DNA polymerase elongation subunit (family B)
MKYDPLIFGKNDTENIVSIEVNDDIAELFIEKDGKVTSTFVPNKFWILSNENIKGEFVRLKGSQHYCWGKQFKERSEFSKYRNLMKNYDLYSIWNQEEALMVKDGYTYFKGMTIDQVSILSFDIETTGFVKDANSQIFLISNTFRNGLGVVEKRLFSLDEYETPAHMYQDWVNWVNEKNPSILCGHNIYMYDLPFMKFHFDREGVPMKIGRDGSEIKFSNYESQFRKDGSQSYSYYKAKVYGREIIDTMFLAIKYDVGRKYDSYGLKDIIAHEGLEVKGRVFYDAGKIGDNWHDPVERQKIKCYAEHDADDALSIFDLMIPSFFYMTQSIPKPFQLVNESATGSQINSIMVRSYLQMGHSIAKADDVKSYEGALSGGVAGIYSNCLKWDVVSLYPSIMRQYAVGLGDKDPYNYFLKLTNYFSLERLKNKKLFKETGDKYYNDLQASQKIFANSLYGFCGTGGLNYNSIEAAEFITKKGREILLKAIKWATGMNENEFMNLHNNQ